MAEAVGLGHQLDVFLPTCLHDLLNPRMARRTEDAEISLAALPPQSVVKAASAIVKDRNRTSIPTPGARGRGYFAGAFIRALVPVARAWTLRACLENSGAGLRPAMNGRLAREKKEGETPQRQAGRLPHCIFQTRSKTQSKGGMSSEARLRPSPRLRATTRWPSLPPSFPAPRSENP